MRKKIVFLSIVFLFAAAILGLFYYYGFLNFSGKEARAISADNSIGWAWSNNIGWISMNCYNDYDGDGILKDRCGNIWWKNYDGGGFDYATATAVDSNNNVIVAGYSYDGSRYDFYTIKYASADGQVLWSKSYNANSNELYLTLAAAIDSNDNVIVSGTSFNGSNYDFYTIKYASADGQVLWSKSYNSGRNDYASATAIDSNDNVIVAGYSYNGSNYDFYTIKYASADGQVLWSKSYNNTNDNFSYKSLAIAIDSNGNVIVSGTIRDVLSHYDFYTIKYASADGQVLWSKRYGDWGNDEAHSLAIDSNDNVIVAGRSYNFDFYTIKYASADGQVLWGKRYAYEEYSYEYAKAVAIDSNDNVIVTGLSHNGYNADFYTIKYASADGQTLWSRRYNGGGDSENIKGDEVAAIAIDSNGNAIVTGKSYNGSNYDFYTIKYASPDVNYGININKDTGAASGYAWSNNIGWIQFDHAGPYPLALPNHSVKYDSATKALSGWAKILNLGNNGWIKFQGDIVSAPANYALCRSCSAGNCDFCYEKTVNGGSGKIGLNCGSCVGAPASCAVCANTYKYGAAAIDYGLAGDGIKKIFEGWAWNDGSDKKNIGWIHFDYAYANENLPFSFNSFTAVPSQVPPPSACISADLGWELASWPTSYEIKKADNGGLGYTVSQDCGALAAGDYSVIIPVNLSNCGADSCLYQDSALRENRYYCYKVFAFNDSGSIENSDGPKQAKTPLCAPSNLTAIETICGEITLNWSDKDEETGYKVYHSLADTDSTSTAVLIATLGADIISYKDEDIIPRQTYYYLLTALTATDESPSSKISGETLCYKGAEWEEK